jgi:hypothetical protein
MPKVLAALLCDDVRRELGNKQSVMGIFSSFNVGDFTKPLQPFHLFAIIGFEKAGQHSLDVELHTIQGEKRFAMTVTTDVNARQDATDLYVANIDLRLGNLTVPRPGLYEFSIKSDGQFLAAVRFDVKVRQPRMVQ